MAFVCSHVVPAGHAVALVTGSSVYDDVHAWNNPAEVHVPGMGPPPKKQTGSPHEAPLKLVGPQTSPAAALHATDAPHVVPSVEHVWTPLPSAAQRVPPGAQVPLQPGVGRLLGPHGFPLPGLHVVGVGHWFATQS